MAFWPSRTDFRFAEGASDDLNLLAQYADRLEEIVKLAAEQHYDFTAAAVIRKVASETSGLHPVPQTPS
jgi:hypothetical protein